MEIGSDEWEEEWNRRWKSGVKEVGEKSVEVWIEGVVVDKEGEIVRYWMRKEEEGEYGWVEREEVKKEVERLIGVMENMSKVLEKMKEKE